jgi:hypothetical protein
MSFNYAIEKDFGRPGGDPVIVVAISVKPISERNTKCQFPFSSQLFVKINVVQIVPPGTRAAKHVHTRQAELVSKLDSVAESLQLLGPAPLRNRAPNQNVCRIFLVIAPVGSLVFGSRTIAPPGGSGVFLAICVTCRALLFAH